MRVRCLAPGCAERRRHHEDDTPRGPQFVEVPDLDQPGLCSMECAAYAGVLNLSTGELRPREEWHIEWPPKEEDIIR